MWEETTLDSWISRASFALHALYSPDLHCFLRNSQAASVANPTIDQTGSMSTNRGFLAFAEEMYDLLEDGREQPGGTKMRASQTVADMVLHYYACDAQLYRSHSAAVPNMFTDAHALVALSSCLSPQAISLLDAASKDDTEKALRNNHRALASSLLARLLTYHGGRFDSDPQESPVVTVHVVRAIDSAASVWDPNGTPSADEDQAVTDFMNDLIANEARRRGRISGKGLSTEILDSFNGIIRATAREGVLRQLGLHIGKDPEFDPASLLASCCTLQRYGGRSGRNLIVQGMNVLSACQDTNGSWSADLLTSDSNRLVYVSSFEMAVMAANLLMADLSRGDTELVSTVEPMLLRSYSLLESGYMDLTRPETRHSIAQRGWGNDRTRQSTVVEGWTTSLALQLLLRMRRIRDMEEQLRLREDFRQVRITASSTERWPDIDRILPKPDTSEPELDNRIKKAFRGARDPFVGRTVVKGLVADVVKPVLTSPVQRPEGISSFLLFGPPGTGKTSIVNCLARALEWPIITISPSDFLLDGIDAFEARADALFSSMAKLRRVVILFDECEELFRRRVPTGSPDVRTHGAFITPGMLPRLQALRRRNWVIFAIATNADREDLDPAVLRRGRLDRRQHIAHPQPAVQAQYLGDTVESGLRKAEKIDESASLTDAQRKAIKDALASYWETVLKKKVEDRDHQLKEAQRSRDTGNFEEYVHKMWNVHAMETDIPFVSFSVLDEASEALVGAYKTPRSLTKALVLETITRCASADAGSSWANEHDDNP